MRHRSASRTLLWLLLPFALAASACEVFPNPVYPTSFDTSVEVVAKGTGTEYSIQELFPDDDGNQWLYFGSDDYSSRWMTWRTSETVELNGRQIPTWKQSAEHQTVDGWIEVTDKAVLDFGNVHRLYPCSIPRLHAPVSVGKAWRTDCLDDGYMTADAIALAVERVRTDVGWVDALRVEYTIQNSYAPVNGGKNVIEGMGPTEKETWWFSPGIGVVMKASGYNAVRILRYGFVKGRSVEGDLTE
jgi:hypothetical protein